VTVGTQAAAVVDEVTLRTQIHMVTTAGGNAQKGSLELLHRLLQPDAEVRESETRHPDRVLFRLDDWPGSFDELISRWFRLREETAPALNLVMGLAYAPPRWSDTVVLTWAQAFEAYHRIRFKGQQAEVVASERLERVLASSPVADREWLRVRLEHADEPSLRRRIKDVVDRVRPIVDPLLKERTNFGAELGQARNTYSHFGAVPQQPGGSGSELHDLAETAHWIFMANLLLDIGFEETLAKGLLNRNLDFKHLVSSPAPVALE
jgi:hypothetical protein